MKTEKKLFPLYTDLTQKKAVVIGGGKIRCKKDQKPLGFVGELVVIAPDVQPEIRELAKAESWCGNRSDTRGKICTTLIWPWPPQMTEL